MVHTYLYSVFLASPHKAMQNHMEIKSKKSFLNPNHTKNAEMFLSSNAPVFVLPETACLPAIVQHTQNHLYRAFTYPVLNILHAHAAALVPRGGGMANMLSSYCIPAQRLAVTAIARGASALKRTCTASAAP